MWISDEKEYLSFFIVAKPRLDLGIFNSSNVDFFNVTTDLTAASKDIPDHLCLRRNKYHQEFDFRPNTLHLEQKHPRP